MGKIISRFRKQPTTLEELERIDNEIQSLLRLKRRDGELEKQYVGTLFLYSVIIYIIMALVFYFYFIPEDWTGRVIQISPFLLFPFLILLVRRLIRFYFVKRISRCDIQLGDLRAEKKKILEEVKEKESYKKAKEILEKYDPASVSPPPPPVSPVPTGMSSSTVTPALRQRIPPGRGRGRGRGMATPMVPNRQTPLPPGTPWTPQVGGPRPMSRPPSTVRPILQQNRGTVDKLVDYLVGDGPSNRYALICKHCYSHNGMALQEEFEYIAFKCPFCGTFNPSRKTRPSAPKLPESGPSSSAEQASSADDQSGSESEGDEQAEDGTNMLTAPPSDATSRQDPSVKPQTEPPSDDPQDMDTEQLAQDEMTATETSTAAVEETTPEVSQQPEVS